MKRAAWIAIAAAGVGLAWWGGNGCRRAADPAEAVETVREGPMEVWSVLEGTVESRFVREIMSDLQGLAMAVQLAPDGAAVQAGEVVVRFDGSMWERELLRMNRDATVAREDYESLVRAKLPLEEQELQGRAAAAWQQYSNEVSGVDDNRELLSEGLISAGEVAQQAARAEAARAQALQADRQANLTLEFLHPAARERARAVMDSAEQEASIAARQLSNCVVVAPCAGMLAHKAISLGSDFRTVRVGDGVYRNQPFLTISDMSNMVLRCTVPESDLLTVVPGAIAEVRPLAYPELRLRAAVESVGGMAQAVAGKPGGQKYFAVLIRLEDVDRRLRPGMSAEVRVRAYASAKSLLIPRVAVFWNEDQTCCEVLREGRWVRAPVRLGQAGLRDIEVLDGLSPREKVRVP